MQGYLRKKTRPQAQQELPFQQRSFGGGQNSDLVATKIAAAEVALSVNTVHTTSDIQGHWGRKLLTPRAWPGSGRLHSVAQHPTTGRWLVHRGEGIWISTGRDGTGWEEVTVIGPDGSLEKTGKFTDGNITVGGPAASFLSNATLVGLVAGDSFTVQITDAGSGNVQVGLYNNTSALIAQGSTSFASTPTTVNLIEEAGSGISGTIDLAAITGGATPVNGTVSVDTYLVFFALRGLTVDNTDDFTLYWDIEITSGTFFEITFYKDAAKTEDVATVSGTVGTTVYAVTPLNDSNISGTAQVPDAGDNGAFSGNILTFSSGGVEIDSDSTISPFRENGFVVFVRGDTPKNIFADQRINKFWQLSTINGYGNLPLADAGSGDYQYRYLYTYSRIVDPTTALPAYDSNRTDGLLEFEGPSPFNFGAIDYGTGAGADPVSSGDPISLPLLAPAVGPIANPVNYRAAAYITHLSIYRTLDVGPNGVGPNGLGNNTELYGWIADVPIYSTEYEDTTDDATLRNNLIGASQEQDSLALRSRLYREMPKGIGAIGPDFMFTAAPLGGVAAYCDLAANPRLIGYHFPGSQRWLVNDPICEIRRTKELFVVICPSSTYTCVAEVQAETGIAGLIPILTLQNFDPSSKTLGIKYGQGVFPVDDNSFVSLLSDGTVRVFSSSAWGEPLDGENVHGITELAVPGAVFAFQRGTLLMWLRTIAGDEITGAGAAYLSDMNLPDAPGITFYGRIENIGGGDGYVVNLYTDSDRTNLVSVASWGPNPMEPQTLTFIPVTPGGPAGTVFADISTATLPADFIFTDDPPICLRYGTGGTNGNKWTTIGRDTWAYPPPWCGAMIVEDDSAALRMAVFDETSKAVFAVEDPLPLRQFTDDIVELDGDDVVVIGQADFPSLVRLREITGAQENFTCFHQESHIAVRPRYGLTALPAGLLFTVRGYESGILNNGATTIAAPVDFDIQFFARLEAKQIQVEYESNKSGWRITSFDTLYQSQDMQSSHGPWDSPEAQYQAELSGDLVSWLYGDTGLIDRASPIGASYTGASPEMIPGPGDTVFGQRLDTPVTRSYVATLTDYTLMFWTLAPTLGAASQTGSVAYLTPEMFAMFPSAGEIIASGISANINPPVVLAGGWQHFAIVREGIALKIYQNGALISTESVPATPVDVTEQIIGCAEGRQDVDDVRLYGAARSAEAIAYYYNDVKLNNGKKVLP